MWGLVSVLKEMEGRQETPWFSVSMGDLVASVFPSSRLALLPIGWVVTGSRARVGRKERLGLLHHERIGEPRKEKAQGRSSQQMLCVQSGLSPRLLLLCLHFPAGVRAT